jgi:hypothetical protein
MSASPAVSQPRRGDRALILTRGFAVFLALHGVAHVAGTSDSWAKAGDGDSVDYLAGAWTITDPALLRVFGVLWGLIGAAFVLVAAVTWLRRPAWPRALAAVSAVSLVLVTVALWASVIGVVIDVALLAVAWRAGGVARRRAQR